MKIIILITVLPFANTILFECGVVFVGGNVSFLLIVEVNVCVEQPCPHVSPEFVVGVPHLMGF